MGKRMINCSVLFWHRCSDRKSPENEAYLAYLSEGMGNLQNWDMVMKHQRKNGSLFNSPSTTAASLNYIKNTGCLNYLSHLLEKFGNAGKLFLYPC